MNQDQYLQLRAARPYLDQYHAVGSVSIPHDVAQMMQKVHGELYGGGFNNWCQACVIEALTRLMVDYDKYEAASAPVIVSAGQTAKANVTKRGRKRNTNPD
jgi:glutaredoxin-related protein